MAINKLFKKIAHATAGIAMVAGVALAPSTASAADGKVSYKDIRNETTEVVEAMGPLASGHNRIALKVNGGTDELNKAIYIAAQQIEALTDRDVFFLHSTDDDLSDGKTKIEIYISGRKTGTLTVFDTDLINEQLVAVVNHGIEKMNDREAASIPTASINAPTHDQS